MSTKYILRHNCNKETSQTRRMPVQNIVYVTGHKNPDTDSICAAIAYAELKKKLGMNAVAVRLGNINRETEFVLSHFGLTIPPYLETVKTQVSDLDMDVVNPASPDISVKTAWMIMKKNNFKSLPVVDENDRLLGMVTLSDIAGKYMDALEENLLSSSHTPLDNIVETLNAQLLCGSHDSFQTTGRVLIASNTPDVMEPHIERGDIVIVGNRTDSQHKAIELGVSCMITTCGHHPPEDVLHAAQEKGVAIVATRFDSFATARLINQSVPIGFIMSTSNIISFDLDDFIDDIRDKMLQTRYRSYPVVDSHNKVKGLISRYHLISQRKKKVILLDHNEKAQTVNGIDQAEILEIIDHHKVGDIQTKNPVYFKNEPVGSTSTIVANLFFENGIRPTRSIAGILCAAILSDTIKFKSPTSTYVDRTTCEKLAYIAGIDMDDFSFTMFKKGSSLEGKTPEEIFHQDLKEYTVGKYRIGIAQVNTLDTDSISHLKNELLSYMEHLSSIKNCHLLILMVTDILHEGSELLVAGKDKILIEKAFQVDVQGNSVYLQGVISRKKQVIPLIANAIEQHP